MTQNNKSSELVHFRPVSEIDAQIQALFNLLKEQFTRLLPCATIEHIGSTAIPNSLTKGDLDILLLVAPEEFEGARRLLAQHFGINAGTQGDAEFFSFVCKDHPIDIGIQLLSQQASWPPFIEWRELLLKDDSVRNAYDALKQKFEGKLMAQYRDAKEQLIDRYFPDPDD